MAAPIHPRAARAAWAAATLLIMAVAMDARPSASATPPETDALGLPLERPGDPPGVSARALPGAAAQSVTFGRFTSIQVNVAPGGVNVPGDAANEPSIAVSPLDHSKMAIGWRQFDTITSNFREAGYAWTTDGGFSWTKGEIEPGVFRSDPVLSFDAQGNFYYSSLTASGGIKAWLFRSTDGGATWGPAVDAYGGDKQWITIDRTAGPGAGHIYQAWSSAGNSWAPNQFNRSVDGGQSFELPSFIPDSPLWGTLDVATDGTLYVAGRSPTSASNYVARSTNAENALVVPPTFSTVLADLGGFVVTGAPNGSGLLGQVSIAVDRSPTPRNGWIYVLGSVRTPTDPLDVNFIRSTDGGLTWSTPVRVNDDPTGNGAYQWFGTMSVSPDGRIDVVWNDTRGSADSTMSALYCSFSYDGGQTWTVNEQASPVWQCTVGYPNQNKIGDYYHMISDASGADLAWAATFNGEQDVYYMRVTPPPLPPCPTPIALTSYTPVQASADPTWYSITPASSRWSAVGVRSHDVVDWNLEAFDAQEPPATCYSGPLAASNELVDVLVTDWRHRGIGTDYVRVGSGTGQGTFGRVEYAQAADERPANAAFVTMTTGPGQLLSVNETLMFAGIPYRIRVVTSAGLQNLRLLVFGRVTSGSGWLPKSAAAANALMLPSQENVFTFTPTTDGMHAIVLVNEDAAIGEYKLSIGRCPFAASAPAQGSPFFIGVLDDWPVFTPTTKTWAAVGIRGPSRAFNLDVAPSPRSQIGPFPSCTDSILGSQYSGLGVRFVTVDLRSVPLRTYTGHASIEGQDTAVNPIGIWEWEGGASAIVPGNPAIGVIPPANNVLDAWGVTLTAGHSYDVTITPMEGATANYQALLFKNPAPGTPCWANRDDAVLATSGTASFAAPATGLYGLVVVNDNGGSGGYQIGISSGTTVAVGDELQLPTITRIASVSPNPARGPVVVAYDLARSGTAAFVVRDVGGRTVASLGAGARPRGRATVNWNGIGRDGRPVPAGVYFVGLVLDGREVGSARVLVLR